VKWKREEEESGTKPNSDFADLVNPHKDQGYEGLTIPPLDGLAPGPLLRELKVLSDSLLRERPSLC
jgi:hypothetical protein